MYSSERDTQAPTLNETVAARVDRQIYMLNAEEQNAENTGRKPLDCVDVTTGYTTSGDRVTTDGVVVPGGRDTRYVRVYTNYNIADDYLPGDVTPTPRDHETNWQRCRVEEFKKHFEDMTTKAWCPY
jgi:hypothetical protein